MAVSSLTYSREKIVLNAYMGSVYDPVNDRLWLVPYEQGPEEYWHYIDCSTGEVIAYKHGASGFRSPVSSRAYWGGAYDPINRRVFFAPYYQSSDYTWHYINCDSGEVRPYGPSESLRYAAYCGASYDPIRKRVYFAPYGMSVEDRWHYVDCNDRSVVEYKHGTSGIINCRDAVYVPSKGRIYFISSDIRVSGYEIAYIQCSSGEVKTFSYTTDMLAYYQGGVFDPTNNRIYLTPYSTLTKWHYIDCDNNTVVSYTHGATVNEYGYWGGVLDTVNGRIYLVPHKQATSSTWHYINCATGAVVGYARGAVTAVNMAYCYGAYSPASNKIYFSDYAQSISVYRQYIDCSSGSVVQFLWASPICSNQAYWGSVYDPNLDRIYFVPFAQASQPVWHYYDCAYGRVRGYVHGVTALYNAYKGGVYDPLSKRIYLVPYEQGNQSNWHYIDCMTGDVIAYAHGAVSVSYAYDGGVYDPEKKRVYFAPAQQADETNWHYIEGNPEISETSHAVGDVVSYPAGSGAVANAYSGAAFDPINLRVYFAPSAQAPQSTWHYIDCDTTELEPVVVGYNPGVAPVLNAYAGAIYDSHNERIWFVPCGQADETFWHYFDCGAQLVVPYEHNSDAVDTAYVGGFYADEWKKVIFTPYSQSNRENWHFVDCILDEVVSYNHFENQTVDALAYVGDGALRPAVPGGYAESIIFPPHRRADEFIWHYVVSQDPPVPPEHTLPDPIPEQNALEDKILFRAHFTVPETVDSIWYDGTVLLASDSTTGKIHTWIRANDGSWNTKVIQTTADKLIFAGYAGDCILLVDGETGQYCLYYDGVQRAWQNIGISVKKFVLSRIVEGSYSWSQWLVSNGSSTLKFFWFPDGAATQTIVGTEELGVYIDIGFGRAVASGKDGLSAKIFTSDPATPDRDWVVEKVITLEEGTGSISALHLVDDVQLFIDIDPPDEESLPEGEEPPPPQIEIWEYTDEFGWERSGFILNHKFGVKLGNSIVAVTTDPLDKNISILRYSEMYGGWGWYAYIYGEFRYFGRIYGTTTPTMDGEGSSLAVLSLGHIHVYDIGDSWVDAGRVISGSVGFRILSTDGTRILAISDWDIDFFVVSKVSGKWEFESRYNLHDYGNYDYISGGGIYGNYAAVAFHEPGMWWIGVFAVGEEECILVNKFHSYTERQLIIGDGFLIVGEYGYYNPVQVMDFEGNVLQVIADTGPALAYDHETGILVVGNEVVGPTSHIHYGEAYVWRGSGASWVQLAILHPPSVFIEVVEYGQSVATSGNWVAVGTSDCRIFMYQVFGSIVALKQVLYADHALWGIVWSMYMDQSRLYVGYSGGDLETDGPAAVWELRDGVWYFRQHLRSSDFLYDSNGATEMVGVGDDIFSCNIYYGSKWDPYRGSLVLWQPGSYFKAGSLQKYSGVGFRLGSSVAASSNWVAGTSDEGDVYVFFRESEAWINKGALSKEADMLKVWMGLNDFEENVIEVVAASPSSGKCLAAARDWFSIASDEAIRLYTCFPPTITQKQQIDFLSARGLAFSDENATYLAIGSKLVNVSSYEHGVDGLTLEEEPYSGCVYDPTNKRIWFIPYNQPAASGWHYIDCEDATVHSYSPSGLTLVEEAYRGGVYDPVNDRIWFVPYKQGPEEYWHYIDCDTVSVIEYRKNVIEDPPVVLADVVEYAYFEGVYDSLLGRIWLVPYMQGPESHWHYIDCSDGLVKDYVHGVSAVEEAYRGAVIDAENNRVYFVPFGQSSESNWHFINSISSTVTAYVHGTSAVEFAYWGGCYDATNKRVWLAPYNQSTEENCHCIDCSLGHVGEIIEIGSFGDALGAYCGAVYVSELDIILFLPFSQSIQEIWHYADCRYGRVSKYETEALSTLGIEFAYYGGAYYPDDNRVYFSVLAQIPEAPDPDPEVVDPRTFWHYVYFVPSEIYKRSDEVWSLFAVLESISCVSLDSYFPFIIIGDGINEVAQIWYKLDDWFLIKTVAGPEGSSGFGKYVSISGNFAAIGSDDSIYVYKRTGTSWDQVYEITVKAKAVYVRRDLLVVAEVTSDWTNLGASIHLYKLHALAEPELKNSYWNFEGAAGVSPRSLAINFFGNIITLGAPSAANHQYFAYEHYGSVNVLQQVSDVVTGEGVETRIGYLEEKGQSPFLMNLDPQRDQVGVNIRSHVKFVIYDNNDNIQLSTALIYINGTLAYSGITDDFFYPFSKSNKQRWYVSQSSRGPGFRGYYFDFVHDERFPESSYIVVQVSVFDGNSNLLDLGYEFLTRENQPPLVSYPYWIPITPVWPIGHSITFQIEDEELGLLRDSILVWVDGELAYDGAQDLFLAPYDGIFSGRSIEGLGYRFVLDRRTDFDFLQTVTVRVYARDVDGLEADETAIFITEPYSPNAGYFPCLHYGPSQMENILMNPDVLINRSSPWTDIDGNGDLVLMCDDSVVTMFTMSLPIGQKFTFEITFKPSALPTNLDQLDVSRLFIAVFDEQDNAGGVLISKSGIAIVSSFGNSVLPIAGSQNLFTEGDDYHTMRIVVDGAANAMDLYVTLTADLIDTGHVLRYTTGAPVTPETVPDSIRIEVVGQPSARTEISIDSMYGNCTELVAPNRRPIADTGDDQTAVIGSVVMLDGTASYDPEGEDLTYLWSVVGTPSTSEFKQVGDDGFTIDDGDADGFTTIFQVTSGDPWSAENSPNLQPGDILVVSNVQYVISTVDWVTNPLGGWLRDVGFDPNQLICTLDALPDSMSGKQWTVYFQSSFWDDRTKPQPTFVPDISGPYDIQLVVNDGDLDSLPAAGFVNISETNTVFGYIPDVNFIWEHLSDVWNLYDDRDRVTTIWSGFAQIATNLLLTAWQNDYSKSLVDIQRQFQRRWLHYDPLYLEPEDDRDGAELRIVRGKILTPVTGGKTFDSAGETLIISKNGVEVTITFAGAYTTEQIAAEINAELGDSASVIQPASIETDTGVDYLSLQYDGLLVISKDGTANATFGFSESEDTQNDLSGVDGVIGTATTAWVTGSAGVSPDNLTNLSEVVEKGDVLVVGGQGYEILKIASSRQLTTRRDLSGSGNWLISSYVKAKTTNFSEQLVYAGDILILEVRYAGSNDTREVLCEVMGVRETRCGFNPRSLLEYTAGDLDAYEITFKGVRRVSAIPVNELVLRIPRLQEIILDPPSVLILNSQYTLQDTADGIRGIFFTDGLFSYDNPPPDQLWAEQTFLDNKQSIEDNFGNVIGFPLDTWEQLTEDLDYLSAVRGLWYAFFNGPSLYNVRIGTQILLGLPFAEVDGIIEDINLTYSAAKIRLLIKDSADEKVIRSYFIPRNVVWEEDGESMVAVNPATGTQYVIGDSVEQFAPLSAGVEIIDWVKDPLWWQGYANQGAMLEIHKYFKFLLLADVDSFNITNLIFAIDFVKKFKPHYTYPFWAVLKRIPPDSINLTDHMELSGYLHLSDDPTTAGALGTGGSLRFDDTDESGRVNWAYDGSMGGGEGDVESGQFGEIPFGDDPFGQSEVFVAGVGEVSKPAFLYDRRRLCPGEYVVIVMSEFHPGGVFSSDFLAVFNNTAYPDGGFPFSGPVAEPPSSAEGSPVSAMMNIFGTSSLGTMPFGKGGTIAGSGGGDYDWGPEIGEIDPLASYPAGYYSRGRVIEDSGL